MKITPFWTLVTATYVVLLSIFAWSFHTSYAANLKNKDGEVVGVTLEAPVPESIKQNLATFGTPDYTLKLSPFAETVMTIKGIPQKEFGQHLRPADPSVVDVRLYTKDGKAWKAKWVEVKP